ncbi:MAG: MBL fold hydrolase [Betaproteobacteria bacterium RIFCSPLOWO2_12_FULL_68_19]|nr:MAG: MBL fold hydrolase [Betaproteobacteria bacterium RIFCSPLOWO2_12_FULL_68_19]
MKLSFLGAAGEVTGSCYLVDTGEVKFLIDCGMFQGGRAADAKNRRFGFDPREIAFVLLSHAHIDHSGLIPRLVAMGFSGAVYATAPTCDLLEVMLPDSGYLQEKELDWSGDAPLYTMAQARQSLSHLLPVEYDAEVRPHASVRCRFRDAGHILGSSILEIWLGKTKLVFSGDLGQPGRPVVADPTPIEHADVLLVDSTYGNRDHKSLVQTLDELAFALNDTLASRKGNVVIPAFAVGRTQELLHLLADLQREKRLPRMNVFVDSPMALAATRITLKYARLPRLERVSFTEDVEDSKRINAVRSGAVIISASGMCEGGRIRHHLRCNISRPECAIVFVGFQAAGTLGRRIVDGEDTIRLFGESYPVRARVFTIGGLSAHADRSALLGWLGKLARPPKQTWVVHGEPLASHALRDAIRAQLGWRAEVPEAGSTTELA